MVNGFKRCSFIVLMSMASLLCAHTFSLNEVSQTCELPAPASFCGTARSGQNAVISAVEWQELQMDDLVAVIAEHATTKLGPIGLQWLLMPSNDQHEIENRQRNIRVLIENPQLLDRLESTLQSIKKGEAHLLKSPVMPSELQRVSYHVNSHLDAVLNKSAAALDVSALINQLFLPAGLIYVSAIKLISLFYNYDWNCRKLTPEQRSLLDNNQEMTLSEASYLKLEGSAGDRIKIAQAELFNNDKFVSFAQKYLGRFAVSGIKFSPSTYRIFSCVYVYGDQIKDDLMVLIPCAFIYWLFKQLHDVLASQQAKYVEFAHTTRAFKQLGYCIQDITQRAESMLTEHVAHFVQPHVWNSDIAQLVELLENSTFDATNQWWYRRGNVVKASYLHEAVGQKIIPFLQTIAEWDAYCALAKMYKAVEQADARYCFAEFVDSKTPYLALDYAWTPLARATRPVGNTVRMGLEGYATRLFLTGPNGCGKSTYMKAILHSIAMAQSVGIVPASRAQIALFDGIRTSLHPQEDVLQGISTFMAQKLRIDSVMSFAQESSQDSKVLVMFDEPFSGTIDTQIELRVLQLGQELIRLPYAAACIATHVERPTSLAAPGVFDNYQVEVKEISQGEFTRTFKILPGVAHWWFADQAKVTRFVDWLGRYKKK